MQYSQELYLKHPSQPCPGVSIAVIVLAILVAALVVGNCVWCFLRTRKKDEPARASLEPIASGYPSATNADSELDFVK